MHDTLTCRRAVERQCLLALTASYTEMFFVGLLINPFRSSVRWALVRTAVQQYITLVASPH